MIHAHIIAAIRAGKLASITRTEWLEVADALETAPAHAVFWQGVAERQAEAAAELRAKAAQPTPPAEPTALEAAVLALLDRKQIAAMNPIEERFWRSHYRAVARQCGHGKSLDGKCAECGDGVRK